MKHRRTDGAGYLEIDHRESPGLSPADVAGIPGALAVGAGEHFETDVYECGHCQRGVILRSSSRERMQAARGYCAKCDRYICNACERARVASGGACVPFAAVLDQAAEVAAKYSGQPDHPDAIIDPAAITTPRVAVPSGPAIVLTDPEPFTVNRKP